MAGLRNWPEVVAFPDRMDAAELDIAAASRLAFGFKKSFELEFAPETPLVALLGLGAETLDVAPQ